MVLGIWGRRLSELFEDRLFRLLFHARAPGVPLIAISGHVFVRSAPF
jgi:hypothetical protein